MELELRELIIKVLKGSENSLSPVELFNYFLMKDLIRYSSKDDLEIQQIRNICRDLANERILIEKGSGKYTYNIQTVEETDIEPIKETSQPIEPIISGQKNKTKGSSRKNRFFDLFLVIILIISSIVFILIPPFNQSFLRIALALPFLLFIPGYLFILAIFPG